MFNVLVDALACTCPVISRARCEYRRDILRHRRRQSRWGQLVQRGLVRCLKLQKDILVESVKLCGVVWFEDSHSGDNANAEVHFQTSLTMAKRDEGYGKR